METSERPPGVWYGFVVYSLFMVVVYLAVAGVGAAILLLPPEALDLEPVEAMVQGVTLVGVGFVLLIPFLIAPFLPRRYGVWVFDLILICVGMTSCCMVPASVALLVFWVRPETHEFFRRGSARPLPEARDDRS